MSKDFAFLKTWLDHPNPRPVVLECIPSRSGLSMAVYDRGERIFTVNGYGFDRLGCALAEFLERCFTPELAKLGAGGFSGTHHNAGASFTALDMAAPWEPANIRVSLNGCCGFSSMSEIAKAIGLKVHQSESKAGTLIIIEKGN